jgi:hypothetical protein
MTTEKLKLLVCGAYKSILGNAAVFIRTCSCAFLCQRDVLTYLLPATTSSKNMCFYKIFLISKINRVTVFLVRVSIP